MKKKLWIAGAAFLLDRAAKILAERLPRGGLTLIPGVLRLRYTRNTGMAFSLLSGHPVLLAALSALVLAGAFFLLRGKRMDGPTETGLMMMLGGAAGNLADRIFAGSVPDMIEPVFVRFAVFNLADAFLVVGCALVIIRILFGKGTPGGAPPKNRRIP